MKQAPIHYNVTIDNPNSHLFSVELTVTQSQLTQSIFRLPTWLLGSYMIRDFAKNIISITAKTIDGQLLAIEQLDKQTWSINNNQQGYMLTYEIYAFDTSVRTAYLDQFRGFFNGTSLFLQIDEFKGKQHSVKVSQPRNYKHWRLATGLTRQTGDNFDFGLFCADNYLELVDHPFEMSNFDIAQFEVKGIPHYVVISGQHSADLSKITHDLQPICAYHLDFFDKPYPVSQYLFLINVVGNGFGGLEHLNSTALLCSRDTLPTSDKQEMNDDYQTFLSLCSHEYFHTWNIKRIKPQEFVEPDLSQEVYTQQLWFYEGITSYIDDWSLNQTGLTSAQAYLDTFSKTVQRLTDGSGRHIQSAAESSFNAWTKFYKQDENASNAIVSYYVKGAVIALCLDLHIRQQSNQQYQLRDLMRSFWQDWNQNKQGTHRLSFVEKCKSVCNIDIADIWQQWVEGVNDLPLASYLSHYGVEYTEEEEKQNITDLGFTYSTDKLGLKIKTVKHNSPAMLAGLSAQDNVIAINGLQIVADKFPNQVNTFKQHDSVSLHVFRRDELFTCDIDISGKTKTKIKLSLTDKNKAQQWLKLSTDELK